MYKWKLEFVLNNGVTVVGTWNGEENNSDDVAKKILVGKNNEFIGVIGVDKNHNLFVKREDICALDISIYAEDKEDKDK